MDSAEYTLFERFVGLTDSLWWFAETHPYFGVALSAVSVLGNWSIFRYHLAALSETSFLLENIEVTGRFSRPTYEMWKWTAITAAPFGLLVIAFTIVTQAKTIPFLAWFGIRGVGTMKVHLVSKALHQHTVLKHFNLKKFKTRKR